MEIRGNSAWETRSSTKTRVFRFLVEIVNLDLFSDTKYSGRNWFCGPAYAGFWNLYFLIYRRYVLFYVFYFLAVDNGRTVLKYIQVITFGRTCYDYHKHYTMDCWNFQWLKIEPLFNTVNFLDSLKLFPTIKGKVYKCPLHNFLFKFTDGIKNKTTVQYVHSVR